MMEIREQATLVARSAMAQSMSIKAHLGSRSCSNTSSQAPHGGGIGELPKDVHQEVAK
jgi:hypothetical protein